MIITLGKHKENSFKPYDVLIVGSGPAGMSLVNELCDSGLRVAILESGINKPTPLHDSLKNVEYKGIQIKAHSRERVLGGASTTWSGLSSPLDPIDYTKRSFVKYSGWPITAEDLNPYYVKASEKYGFPSIDFYGKSGFIKVKQQSDLQLELNRIEEKIFLASDNPLDYGKNFISIFENKNIDLYLDATVTRLLKSENGRVEKAEVYTSSIEKIEIQSRYFVIAAGGIENPRILLQSNFGNGYDQIGRYLMNHPKNNYGWITPRKALKDSPYYFGCMTEGNAGYAGLKLTESEQRNHQVLNSYVRFEPIFAWTDNQGVEALIVLTKNVKMIMKNFRKLNKGKTVSLRDYAETGDDSELQNGRKGIVYFLRLLIYILSNIKGVSSYLYHRLVPSAIPKIRKIRLRNFMEMAPNPSNRVVLGDEKDMFGFSVPRVIHSCSELDKRSLIILHKILEQELNEHSECKMTSMLESEKKWPIDQDASHHLGTTRMGEEVETSVVDSNLKVHGIENVFITGGSVFPTSSCVNPTYTMVALSIRLSNHLKSIIRK